MIGMMPLRYINSSAYTQSPPAHPTQVCLRPHSYQANLDVWTFYLDNHTSQFPPYDTELVSEEDLTPMDLHHNFFGKAQMGIPIEPQGSVVAAVSSPLHKYTG